MIVVVGVAGGDYGDGAVVVVVVAAAAADAGSLGRSVGECSLRLLLGGLDG